MPWTREEKIFCIPIFWRENHLKLCKAKFRRKFNFNSYPQIYRWVNKFQAIGSVNNLNKKAKNLRSGRKLNARCLDNVDAVFHVHCRIKSINFSPCHEV